MCRSRWLWWGDALVILLSTTAGFAVHGTLDQVGRLLLTAGLVTLAWWGTAWSQGLMVPSGWPSPWPPVRILWGMALAVALAVIVRALLLGQPVNPFFPLVMAAVSATLMVLWRWGRARYCPPASG